MARKLTVFQLHLNFCKGNSPKDLHTHLEDLHGTCRRLFKFPGWPASVVLANKQRKWIHDVIEACLHLLLLYFCSVPAFNFLPFLFSTLCTTPASSVFSLKLPVQFCWFSLLLWCLIHIYLWKNPLLLKSGVLLIKLTCKFVVALQCGFKTLGESGF